MHSKQQWSTAIRRAGPDGHAARAQEVEWRRQARLLELAGPMRLADSLATLAGAPSDSEDEDDAASGDEQGAGGAARRAAASRSRDAASQAGLQPRGAGARRDAAALAPPPPTRVEYDSGQVSLPAIPGVCAAQHAHLWLHRCSDTSRRAAQYVPCACCLACRRLHMRRGRSDGAYAGPARALDELHAHHPGPTVHSAVPPGNTAQASALAGRPERGGARARRWPPMRQRACRRATRRSRACWMSCACACRASRRAACSTLARGRAPRSGPRARSGTASRPTRWPWRPRRRCHGWAARSRPRCATRPLRLRAAAMRRRSNGVAQRPARAHLRVSQLQRRALQPKRRGRRRVRRRACAGCGGCPRRRARGAKRACWVWTPTLACGGGAARRQSAAGAPRPMASTGSASRPSRVCGRLLTACRHGCGA